MSTARVNAFELANGDLGVVVVALASTGGVFGVSVAAAAFPLDAAKCAWRAPGDAAWAAVSPAPVAGRAADKGRWVFSNVSLAQRGARMVRCPRAASAAENEN